MASLVGSLYVSLEANFSAYGRGMKQAEAITTSTTAAIRRSAGATERSVTSLQRSMGAGIRPSALIAAGRSFDSAASRANLLRGSVFALTAAFGGLGAALTTNVIARYFDTFTGLENQVRVISQGASDLVAQMAMIGEVSNRSRSSLSAVATLYSRLMKASPDQGPIKALQRVETINKALQLGGATAQEAASAAIQFSQAIASNRLGGEELRAVLETPLGLELAKGMGVTIGEFRKMSIEGKLTADVLYRSLDRISESINDKFVKSIMTIDQSLTIADNAITNYAGSLDDTYGITRAVSGGILGFANNLQTLVPLLATVGAGLGVLFGARRAGGIANTLGAPLAALQSISAIRKQNLETGKQEYDLAVKANDVAKQQLANAQRAASGNTAGFASAATVKAYERNLTQLNKTSREYVSNLQKQANLDAQIANMNGTSAAAIKARETALARYNGLLGRETVLTQKLAQQRDALNKSRGAMNASGAVGAAAGVASAQQAMTQASVGVMRANAGLVEFQKRAALASVAMGGIRAAGSSLIGFLGGPWGVAFTVATTAMIIFGMRAQESAERTRRALAVIDETMEKIGASEKFDSSPGSDRIAYYDARIKAETDRLELAQEQLVKSRDDLISAVSSNFGKIVTSLRREGAGEAANKLRSEIAGVIDQLKSGEITISNFYNRIRELGIGEDVIRKLKEEFDSAVQSGVRAELTVKDIGRAIDALNGKRAKIEVDIGINDPFGIFTQFGDRQKMLEGNTSSERLARNYSQYGMGRDAAREAIDLRSRREALLGAAGDTGDKARNTPAKIAAREQELLEQGYAKTRESARALAAEELNLAESSRQANQSAKSGAKDFENFANKLAELKERAAGSAAGLSDTDQQVLQFAERLKNGSEMMRQYIEAIKSGDLSKAPAQLLEARDAFLQIGASKVADDIVTQYGKGAQLAGKFAEMQEMLNIAVARGDITAQQAAVAFGDFVGQFGEYQWINDLSSALTSFAESAITDFDNIEDAAMSLLKQIGKIILQATVLGPLEQSLRGIFSSSSTGVSFGSGGGLLGGLLGGIGSLFGGAALSPLVSSAISAGAVGLYHDGGTAGTSTKTKTVPSAMFANAQRYHGGNLRANEIAAILQQGETVLRKADSSKFFDSYGRMGAYVREAHGMGGGGGQIEVFLSEGLEARIINQSTENTVRIVKDYDKTTLPGSVERIRSDPYAR